MCMLQLSPGCGTIVVVNCFCSEKVGITGRRILLVNFKSTDRRVMMLTESKAAELSRKQLVGV